MSNLDNLVSKIIRDCETQAKSITDKANEEAAKIISGYEADARTEKDAILLGASQESERSAEQITLKKKLEIRDDSINAKRKTIDRVFSMALEKLNDIPKEQYMTFLNENLKAMDASSGEIILPAKYEIKEKDLPGLTVHSGERRIDGGFILIREGIEFNFTFDALLEYRRHELESEIIKILF